MMLVGAVKNIILQMQTFKAAGEEIEEVGNNVGKTVGCSGTAIH